MNKFLDKNKFEWSEDKQIWHNATINRPPSEMTYGDRYVHVGPGIDCYGFNWSGSTLDDWHCGSNMTFDEAYNWAKNGQSDNGSWFRQDLMEEHDIWYCSGVGVFVTKWSVVDGDWELVDILTNNTFPAKDIKGSAWRSLKHLVNINDVIKDTINEKRS